MNQINNLRSWWKNFNRDNTYVLSLILFIITAAVYLILQPAVMEEGVLARLIKSNFRTWLPVILLAVGQTIVMLGGGLDLSNGAIVSLLNVIMAVSITTVEEPRFNLLIIAAVIVFGLLAGFLNGFFTAVLDLQPMITTFASSFVYSGLALLILPNPGGKIPRDYTGVYRNAALWGIPLSIFVIAAVLLIWEIIKGRKYGRSLFAVGGDAEAAYTTGIRVTWIKISTYVISGLLAALAAISYTLLTGSGAATSGDGMTLTAITAAIIGGTAMSGGSGSLLGAVLGAIILGTIRNIISLARLDSWYRLLINAVVIVVALAGPGIINLFRREKSS
jgi:ribose transport system permease protein